MSACRRCEFDDVDLAVHALAEGHWLCATCSESLTDTEPRICEKCVHTARSLLTGIATMYAELPLHLGHPRPVVNGTAPTDDGRPLLGGDVLVLLAAGSEGLAEDGATSKDTDPPSVSYELGWWVMQWQAARGEHTHMGRKPARVVARAVQYLDTHTRWAANQHAGFAQYLTDLRGLHARLERATGRFIAPEKAGAACFDCHGKLVRRVDPRTGLTDDAVTCRACHRAYTPEQYRLALRDAWTGIEAWVEQAHAARLSGRSLAVIDAWIRRGHVATQQRDEDGKTLVWWPDVQARTRRAS